jgi:glycosyltransferase involved in cell wall biosynthesis
VIKELPKEFPILNANPKTIYDVLKKFLQSYKKNPEEYRKIGKASRKYVEKYHDARKIARKYADLLLN